MKQAEIVEGQWYLGQSGSPRLALEIWSARLADGYPLGTLLASYVRDLGGAADICEEVCTLRAFARWAIKSLKNTSEKEAVRDA